MKTILTLVFLFSSFVVSAQYHIRVECYTHLDDKDKQAYFIKFTNDNWKTENSLHDTYDDSETFPPVTIEYSDLMWVGDNGKLQAIEYAKKFKTYNSCLDYNKSVWAKHQQLLAYRKAHPYFVPKPPKPLVKKQACCKVVQVY